MDKQPHVAPVYGKRKYRLLEDYVVIYKGKVITIPAGFEFDGASIPRALWALVGTPFAPDLVRAALIHDWLYSTKLYSRKFSDKCFKQLLKEAKVGLIRRNAMYTGVRAGGWVSW